MKHLLLITLLFLQGCTASIAALNCMEGAVPHAVSDAGIYEIEAFSRELNLHIKETVSCEKYYDVQCSTRGNMWSYRPKHDLEKRETKINDINAEVILPSCNTLVNDPGNARTFLINDQNSSLRYESENKLQELYDLVMSAQNKIATTVTSVQSKQTQETNGH